MLAGRLGGWLKRGRAGAVAEAPGAGDEAPAAPEPTVGALVREGRLVRLRAHVPANRAAFQRWYADEEIARLLRHDQEPLSPVQSRGYFDTFIMPLSARGLCYAIHEAAGDRLIGTTALTDVAARGGERRSAMFRIVLGEKDVWGRGYGTEATELVMHEAFGHHDLGEVRLEVFRHNPRALAAYNRVGFRRTGEHTEWVGRRKLELHVVEMALSHDDFLRAAAAGRTAVEADRADHGRAAAEEADRGMPRRAEGNPSREERQRERQERREQRRRERPGGTEQPQPAGDERPAPTPEERQQRRAQREERQQRQSQREERRQQRGGGDADPSPS